MWESYSRTKRTNQNCEGKINVLVKHREQNK